MLDTGVSMKRKLSVFETISVASMLFGMFFGAGNLIFPVHLGQIAGNKLLPAFIGFVITGVGLPLLGVAAFGITKTDSLQELASSIKEHGLIEPIVVQQSGDRYIIVAGERRWRACRMAGLKEIPVAIVEFNEQELFIAALLTIAEIWKQPVYQ